MNAEKIPAPIISYLSENMPEFESHSNIDSIFQLADAPGEPPLGSRSVKIRTWLKVINDESEYPLSVLGKILERYLDLADVSSEYYVVNNPPKAKIDFKKGIERLFLKYGFSYLSGGIILSGASLPSKSLSQVIKKRDIPSIDAEFDRALSKVNSEPREAVSAACNILESIFKVYIHDEGLETPQKQDLLNVWKVVRSDLGFEPGLLQDNDLKKILSGVLSVVDGVGALRTHASSAHGEGRKIYNIKPRHARLAINSAHTIALFVIETWDENSRKANKKLNSG